MTKYDDVKPITKEERKEVLSHIEQLAERARRAEIRVKKLNPNDYYLAVSGGICISDGGEHLLGTLPSGEKVTVRPVTETPLATEVYGSIGDQFLVPFILKHAGLVQSELVVENGQLIPSSALWAGIWHVLLSCSLSLSSRICIPYAGTASWSCLAAYSDGTVVATLTNSGVHSGISFSGTQIDAHTAESIRNLSQSVGDLENNSNFHIAANSFTSALELPDERVATATAWSGIEAMFGVSAELRFRIAAYAAAFLEEVGDARLQLYRRTQKLYDLRSKIVHGGSIGKEDLSSAFSSSIDLLTKLITATIRRGGVPSVGQLDQALFLGECDN